jgi:hypothetical protein
MKVEFRVKSKRVNWTRKFKTLAEAQHWAQTAWEYENDPTVYIEKIQTEVVDTLEKPCYNTHIATKEQT